MPPKGDPGARACWFMSVWGLSDLDGAAAEELSEGGVDLLLVVGADADEAPLAANVRSASFRGTAMPDDGMQPARDTLPFKYFNHLCGRVMPGISPLPSNDGT